MKRVFAFMIVATVIVMATFSEAPRINFSAGVGGMIDLGFSTYKSDIETNNEHFTNFGFFLFGDATYAELDLGISFGSHPYPLFGSTATDKVIFIDGELLGKYPFKLGEKISLFPLLGIKYQLALSSKTTLDGQEETNTASDYSNFWLKAGGGIDYNITNTLYLRGEIVFGYKFNNAEEKNLASAVSGSIASFGPSVKIAVGYNLGRK
jgi:hypothetical protein